MKYSSLRSINRLYFTYHDVAKVFKITEDAARVSCSRYVKEGLLVRLKPNFYILMEKWDNVEFTERLSLANVLQVPSYVSLTTALVYYEYTTQVQQNFIESIGLKRTKTFNIGGAVFNYAKIAKDLYFGFEKVESCYIATPEKALMDAIYLESYGRYRIDVSSLDLSRFNKDEICRILIKFPERTIKRVQNLWKT